MTPTQCRMARAALKLSIAQLAFLADSNKTSITNFERGKNSNRMTHSKLKNALESTGRIQFRGENGIDIVDQ